MNRLAATLLALAPLAAVQAQLPNYHAQVFGAEQGIGGGGISDVFRDRRQFLWVVNLSTLQRFDGRNARTYPFNKVVKQALCDRNNRVWALAGGRLWHTCSDRDGFLEVPFDTSGGTQPMAVFQFPDQPLCVLTTRGLFAENTGKSGFSRLPGSPPPPLPYTNLWRFDTSGNVLFYPVHDGIAAFDVTNGQVRTLPFDREIAYLHALTPDRIAVTDYGSKTYWFDFDRSTVTRVDPRRYGLTNAPGFFGITGATPLGGGRFLMTSRIGLLTYDLNTDRFARERIFAAGKPLEMQELLVRIFLDENGTAWAHDVNNIAAFSSLQHNTIGLLRNHHPEPPQAWSNRVIGLTEDRDGHLWFGGAGGFKKMDLRTGKVTSYPAVEGATDRLSHASVRGMGYDGRYVVVGPTDKGVWLFDPKTEHFRRPSYASDRVRRASEGDFIDHLAVLRNGDIVVAGRFHPYRIEAGTYRMDFIRFPGDDSNTNAVYQDTQGRIWIGSHSGVFCLNESYRLLATWPTEPVFCFLTGNRANELLVGTDKGLRRIAFRTAQADTISTPVEGIGVTCLLRDSLQRLWIGSLGGLFLADSSLRVFKKFDFADNLQGLVFNGSACLRTRNGMAFFGGINGINYLFPEKIALEDQPIAVGIAALRINDRDTVHAWQPAGSLRFPYRENTLTVEVVAPYFNNAGKLQYRYRLASGGWISLGSGNSVRLADLTPGDYRLEVAASATGNRWYEASQVLEFSILPPFWQTWPFRISAFSILAGLVFGLIRLRENRLKKRQHTQLELEKLQNANLQFELQLAHAEEERQRALLEAVENQRQAAEAKLQSMRLQMNPHFLFNALNSIQQMTLSGNGDGATLYLSKFSKLLRMVLAHSDHERVPLRDEVAMLNLYLDLEALRFDDTFAHRITCDPALDLDEYAVPPLLIQPFVENAIWHGLLHKEGKRQLSIQFEPTSDDRLRCTIEDNGIGRAAAGDYARGRAHPGKGLSTGAGRIEALNRRYGQQNALEIIDLHNESGAPAGTRVHLVLD